MTTARRNPPMPATQMRQHAADRAEPGYERIADAIDDALQSADLRIELKTGTGSDWGRFTDSYSHELYVLARTLDKAGLIDWAAFAPQPVHQVRQQAAQRAWVDVPQDVRDRATALIHHTLFAEDDTDGPIFRWSEQHLAHDDDTLLKCAADAVVNDLVAHPEVLAELLVVARSQGRDLR